jgi:putative transposase
LSVPSQSRTTANLTSITLTKTPTGKSFAACLFEDGVDSNGEEKSERLTVIPATAADGTDVSLTHIAFKSHGRKTDNPRFVVTAQRNLRGKQKSLSRPRKSSKNRAKARVLMPTFWSHRQTNVLPTRGRHFQHKLSRRLVDENQAICVET